MKPKLLKPREEFAEALNTQIIEGQAIKLEFVALGGREGLETVEKKFRLWSSYTKDWLEQSFSESPNVYSKSFEDAGTFDTRRANAIRNGVSPHDVQFRMAFFISTLAPKIEVLESIMHRLDLIPDTEPVIAAGQSAPLSGLHPTVQQVAGRLFTDGHYPQAILNTYIALDKAVQDKARQSAALTGKTLMDTVFSAKNPILKLSSDPNEQLGFMNLFSGAVQAIRNHYAHNLTELPVQQAIEWLFYASALFRKVDEAILVPRPISGSTQP